MNICAKPVLVHNKTTKLAVLFALGGASIIVVPMLIDQVYARTIATAEVKGPGTFTDVKGHMSEGKFDSGPELLRAGNLILWETSGDPPGSSEKGIVAASFGGRIVIFSWSNPTIGKNTCGVDNSSPSSIITHCEITQGERADALFTVSSSSLAGSCQSGTEENDNLIGTSGDDCIDGVKGDDRISGLAGNDKLNGGDGKDLIVGADGNDELTGGSGPDSFNCGSGNDKINDFKPSEGDKKTSDCEQF